VVIDVLMSPSTAASRGTVVASVTFRDIQGPRKLHVADTGTDADSILVVGKTVGANGSTFYFIQGAPSTPGMTMRMQDLQESVATADGELEGSNKPRSDVAVLVPAIVVPVVVFLACVALFLGVWYHSKKRAVVQQQYASSI